MDSTWYVWYVLNGRCHSKFTLWRHAVAKRTCEQAVMSLLRELQEDDTCP